MVLFRHRTNFGMLFKLGIAITSGNVVLGIGQYVGDTGLCHVNSSKILGASSLYALGILPRCPSWLIV